ncbi:HORMA domain-containing protein 1 [Irineochytrium annulatum]|nr:HORMA domain-containing protein 1 [Irineochytrium annulatum]
MQKQEQRVTLVPSQTESLILVKNLLSSALSAITYLRGLFPEDNFKDTLLNGKMHLKAISRAHSWEADELLDWLEKGCYDALEKRYLKAMVLGIYMDANAPLDMIESYTFAFSYPSKDQFAIDFKGGDGGELKESFRVKTKKEIIKATSDMIRRVIVLTQTLKPLPDDVTPLEYEPPCFRAENPNHEFKFPSRPDQFSLGQLMLFVLHHLSLALSVLTAADAIHNSRSDPEDSDAMLTDPPTPNAVGPPPSPAPRCMSQATMIIPKHLGAEGSLIRDLNALSSRFDRIDLTAEDLGKRGAGKGNDNINTQDLIMKLEDGGDVSTQRLDDFAAMDPSADVAEEKITIDCPCGMPNNDGDLLFCEHCSNWGHNHCFGYTDGENTRIPPSHICYACFNKAQVARGNSKGYDLDQAKDVALFRRAMMIADQEGVISYTNFSKKIGCELQEGKQLAQRLVKAGTLKAKKHGRKKKGDPLYNPVRTNAARKIIAHWMSKESLTMVQLPESRQPSSISVDAPIKAATAEDQLAEDEDMTQRSFSQLPPAPPAVVPSVLDILRPISEMLVQDYDEMIQRAGVGIEARQSLMRRLSTESPTAAGGRGSTLVPESSPVKDARAVLEERRSSNIADVVEDSATQSSPDLLAGCQPSTKEGRSSPTPRRKFANSQRGMEGDEENMPPSQVEAFAPSNVGTNITAFAQDENLPLRNQKRTADDEEKVDLARMKRRKMSVVVRDIAVL